jgi:hypothetical protein
MAVAALVALTSVRASAIRPEPRTYARACGDLAALTIPDTTIASAAPVAAGAFTPPGSSRSLTVPAFCRVSAVAAPSSDSHIAIEVWIPDEWNGKLLGTANGGFAGAIGYPAMAAGLTRGYAVVGTDTGHAGDQLEFADGHPEKVADWAYRSIHVMTDVAKLVVRAARGQLPSHAYFEGCSTGGQQALSEAQRYPGDYDGIVAGDPGHNRVRLILGFLWSWIATHDSEQGWGTYLVNPREPARIGFFRYLAFHDPRWDWRTFDCDRDVAFADAQVPELSATSHDLRAFQARGGKLVMDTGWADPVVPPQDTVAYYDEVVKASGGLARTQSFDVRCARYARRVDRARDRAAAASGPTHREWSGRADASDLRVSEGRALSRDWQHGRRRELRLRGSCERCRDFHAARERVTQQPIAACSPGSASSPSWRSWR